MSKEIGDKRIITLHYANQNCQARYGTSHAAAILFRHPMLGLGTYIDELDINPGYDARSNFYVDSFTSIDDIRYKDYILHDYLDHRYECGRIYGHNIFAMGSKVWGGV